MKYIIVGLGSFGAALAQKLTANGHEVIGVDLNLDKVELLKESISQSICMDATDELTVAGLPLSETDVVVITIGKNQGINVMTTALFKNLKVKRLISRSINPLHEMVLQAIGVDEMVRPEVESAERWVKRLCLKNLVDSFELEGGYSMVEVLLPKRYVGKTVRASKIREEYNLLVLTTIKKIVEKNVLGKEHVTMKSEGVAKAEMILEKDDILVLFGSNDDIDHFTNKK